MLDAPLPAAAALAGAALAAGAAYACCPRGAGARGRPADVYRVAVTGGPCAGKSTGMSHIQEKLQHEGYNVYVVPEAATLLICGGGMGMLRDGAEAKMLEFQLQLLKLQMQMEENFTTFAAAEGKPAVVLCDRGVLDGKAFCTDAQWEWLMARGTRDMGRVWSSDAFCARYDMCLHFTTAAKGAEQFYTTANNTARTETVEEARAQDDKLLAAWAGHAKHRVVPNQNEAFVKKLEDAMSHIFNLIGLTPTVAFKYRLPRYAPGEHAVPQPQAGAGASHSLMTHHVLRGSAPGLVYRLCHKLDNMKDVCSHQVIKTAGKSITKTEEQIGMPAYNNMLAMRDPGYETVVTATTTFAFQGRRYELNRVVKPAGAEGDATLIVFDYHDRAALAEVLGAMGCDAKPVRMGDEEWAEEQQRLLLVVAEGAPLRTEVSGGLSAVGRTPPHAAQPAPAGGVPLGRLSHGDRTSSVMSDAANLDMDILDLSVDKSFTTLQRAVTSPLYQPGTSTEFNELSPDVDSRDGSRSSSSASGGDNTAEF